jgi:hypothetical protein
MITEKRTEADLLRAVARHIKKNYPSCWFYKTADKFTSGIPDLIICKDGCFIAIELKRSIKEQPKNVTLQDITIEKIRKAGGKAAKCFTVEDVDNLLRDNPAKA